MTDTLRELDEAIARARGWGLGPHGWRPARGCTTREAVAYYAQAPAPLSHPPPFSSSWALAGPLLEEMGGEQGNMWSARDLNGRPAWVAGWRRSDGTAIGSAAMVSPCEAIARAWLAMHRSKA